MRKQGKSVPEISKETGVAKTTVLRHVHYIVVPEKFKSLLREKQGGSKARAQGLRENVLRETMDYMGTLSKRDLFFLLVCLYWGEGAKRDFTVINSDPLLIQTLLRGLESIGVSKSRLFFALRVHSNISIPKARRFWSATTGLPINTLRKVEVVDGKKKGKLPYGMCRIRVRSGIRERLRIQSAIALIGKESNKRLLFGSTLP
ncbi:MAG: hypothetical protein KGI73_00320 [Patescibacteria group bacterium]|nr:hypothetical protein [Patescibacteria group bacterium]